jgi:hypothetical protein
MAAHPTLSEAIKEAASSPSAARFISAQAESAAEGVERSGSMSIVNRRNAVLGWTVWQVDEEDREAEGEVGRAEVDADEGGELVRPHRRRLAAAGAVLFFWRWNGSADDLPPAV